MIQWLRVIRNISSISLHTFAQEGKTAIANIKNNIKNERYREALKNLNKLESTHPEYFKAATTLRGKACVGLARQMNLIENKSAPSPNSTKMQPK